MSGRRLRCAAALAASLLLLAGAARAELAQLVRTSEPVRLGEGPGRSVTVEAVYEEAAGVPPAGWRRTLTRLRFRDGGGRLLYQETFAARFVAGQGFEEEVTAGAPLELRGAARRFLLLGLDVVPSAPSAGGAFRVYGFDRRGAFRRLGAPIEGTGRVIWNPAEPAQAVMRLREGRYLDVGQWTGNFTLVLPWAFQEDLEQFAASGLCGKVEADPRPPGAGTVRLAAGPGPGFASRAVRVTPASRVAFLDGCLGYGRLKPGEYTPWIRVRVDAEEGWVPTEEVAVLGLPDAG